MPYRAGGVRDNCFYRGPVGTLGLLGPRKGGGTIKKPFGCMSHGMPVWFVDCHACCTPLGAIRFFSQCLIQRLASFVLMILRSLAVTLIRLPRDLKPGLRKMSLPSAQEKG
jgi:hypothetical protein